MRLLRELYVLYQASGGRGGYYGYHYGDDRSIELSSIGSRQLAAADGPRRRDCGWCTRASAAGWRVRGGQVLPGRDPGEPGGLRIVPVVDPPGDGEPPCRSRSSEPRVTARCASIAPRRRPPSPELAVPAGQAGPGRAAAAAADGAGRRAAGVPAAGEPRFRDRYYPRLRRAAAVISSDGSFTPPAICRPDLVLRARYGNGHELELSWEWAYRVGDSPLRAPLKPGGPEDGYRDLAAERALLA